ncbi:MAG TPA: universal stress protein [Bacteroidia bacterium]|jgi:nucleotide-binding universal stress UspA family protein|nr:universal stress protein [Bacteroidia bacterium]
MSFNLRKILVPIDFSKTSEQALRNAGEIAQNNNAELILMHALHTNEYHFDVPDKALRITNKAEIEEIVNKKLGELAAKTSKEFSVPVKKVLVHGKPAAKIVEWAEEENADLIVMGTHGASGFHEYFAGSNANKVAHLSSVPVITINDGKKKTGIKNIVLPIDRSRHSREKVEAAVKLASACKAKLHILGFIDHNRDNGYKKLQMILGQVEQLAKKEGVEFQTRNLEAENEAVEVLKYGGMVDADLVVTMTDHESHVGKGLLGTAFKHIINHSRIPVMSMNPHYYQFSVGDGSSGTNGQ